MFDEYMPHGLCLRWGLELSDMPTLVQALIGGSAMMFLTYLIVAVCLFVAWQQTSRTTLRPMVRKCLLFGSSVFLLCGATHLMSIVVLFEGAYGIQAVVGLVSGSFGFLLATILATGTPKLVKWIKRTSRAEAVARARQQIGLLP